MFYTPKCQNIRKIVDLFTHLSAHANRYATAISLSTILACASIHADSDTTITIRSANGARIRINAGKKSTVTINAESAAVIHAGAGSEVVIEASGDVSGTEEETYRREAQPQPEVYSPPSTYYKEPQPPRAYTAPIEEGTYTHFEQEQKLSGPSYSEPTYSTSEPTYSTSEPTYSTVQTSEFIRPDAPLVGESGINVKPYIEYAAGKEIGVDHGYTTLGVYASTALSTASANNHLWAYADGNWHYLDNNTNAASIEAGFVRGNDDLSYGGYVAYDTRRWHKNSFDQVTGGFQLISCPWQLILNASIPTCNERTRCHTSFHYEGGYKASVKNFDAAYSVFSALVARNFYIGTPYADLALGVEPYYLETHSKHIPHHDKRAWGAKGRLLFDWSPFNLEASVSHDKIFHARAQVVVGLDILRAYNSNCGCALYRSFRRQQIVPIKHSEQWKWNWDTGCGCGSSSRSSSSDSSGSSIKISSIPSSGINLSSSLGIGSSSF